MARPIPIPKRATERKRQSQRSVETRFGAKGPRRKASRPLPKTPIHPREKIKVLSGKFPTRVGECSEHPHPAKYAVPKKKANERPRIIAYKPSNCSV